MLHNQPDIFLSETLDFLMSLPSLSLTDLDHFFEPYLCQVHNALYIPSSSKSNGGPYYSETQPFFNNHKKTYENFSIRSEGLNFQLLHRNDIRMLQKKTTGIFSLGNTLNPRLPSEQLLLIHFFCPPLNRITSDELEYSNRIDIRYHTALSCYNISVKR